MRFIKMQNKLDYTFFIVTIFLMSIKYIFQVELFNTYDETCFDLKRKF